MQNVEESRCGDMTCVDRIRMRKRNEAADSLRESYEVKILSYIKHKRKWVRLLRVENEMDYLHIVRS